MGQIAQSQWTRKGDAGSQGPPWKSELLITGCMPGVCRLCMPGLTEGLKGKRFPVSVISAVQQPRGTDLMITIILSLRQ